MDDASEWERIAIHPSLPYEKYLATDAWRQRRAYMLRLAGNRCQICNRSGRLEVHHRTYERLGREQPADLTVLCHDCHEAFHKHRGLEGQRSTPKSESEWDASRVIFVLGCFLGGIAILAKMPRLGAADAEPAAALMWTGIAYFLLLFGIHFALPRFQAVLFIVGICIPLILIGLFLVYRVAVTYRENGPIVSVFGLLLAALFIAPGVYMGFIHKDQDGAGPGSTAV